MSVEALAPPPPHVVGAGGGGGYAAFLAMKERRAPTVGIDVDPSELHPALKPHQRDGAAWALRIGRCALFWDAGVGKTLPQVAWAQLSADRSLILAPLSVARQTVREARRIDIPVTYVRDDAAATEPGVYITNYELADRFDPAMFGALVLDESGCLKNVDAARRRLLTSRFRGIPRRLACSATPAPNDVAELTNQAEFLGVMSRAEMLAAYFVNDEKNWRLKGHAAEPMFRWMASWAMAMRRPSDLGYPDDAYTLPPLRIHDEIVDVEVQQDGQLFATDLGGIGGRAKVRYATIDARVAAAAEIAATGNREQAVVWCGLNAEADRVTAALAGDAVNVEGSWAPDAKAEALEAFQDGEIRILVSKPSICGWGMNFQNCARMVFLGIGDSFEAYYQAIRRCWRYGQTRPVDVHIVVSELEQQIIHNVRRKEREAAMMTDALVRHMRAATGPVEGVA